jgi:hypothetical protein
MLAKYREAFKPSRAKDDPTDAELALALLLRHPERFSPLRPQSAGMRSLLSLIEQRRELVGDKTRFTNRLTYALKLATDKGILTEASLSQSSSRSTRNSEYVGGKLVSDVTTPTNTSVSTDLLSLLKPLIEDGEAAKNTGAWQQALSTIHGMILLNASAN